MVVLTLESIPSLKIYIRKILTFRTQLKQNKSSTFDHSFWKLDSLWDLLVLVISTKFLHNIYDRNRYRVYDPHTNPKSWTKSIFISTSTCHRGKGTFSFFKSRYKRVRCLQIWNFTINKQFSLISSYYSMYILVWCDDKTNGIFFN